MLEQQRQRFLNILNNRWIYGRVPLLHTIILFIEMALLSRLMSRWNTYYTEKPVLTMMVTNAVLSGIADTVAQTITSVRQRALRKPGGVSNEDFAAIEIHEFDKKLSPTSSGLIPASNILPPPFDFERLTRFASWGFLMAPIQFKWFQFLGHAFPLTKTASTLPAIKRTLCDQIFLAPIGLGAFFTFMTVAEGGGKRAVFRKLEDVYLPALKAQYLIWPAAQVINFRIMPVQFQVPFVSTVGIFWNVYLSLTNSAEEVAQTSL